MPENADAEHRATLLTEATRLALLVDLYPDKPFPRFPDEDWHPYSRPSDLELMNTAIVQGGRVGTHGDVYAVLVEEFRGDRFLRFNGICYICRSPLVDPQVDHVWPIARYPELVASLENLAPACAQCNKAKGIRDPRVSELEFIRSFAQVDVASPTPWPYRPEPPLHQTFVDGTGIHQITVTDE